MCGIAGIVGTVNDRHREALRRMTAALAHRGPDREGFWASEPDHEGRGCLLVRRGSRSVQCRDECPPLAVVGALGEQLLELIDHQ